MADDPSHNPTWRERLPGRRPEEHFHWRGKEVSRIENLADAVFGFALTLLIVSTEVPRNFDGLMDVLRGFPTFICSALVLVTFWNAHYRFFRRFGLEDGFTRMINYVILMMVLFAVYPLKFLFSAWMSGIFGGEHVAAINTLEELRWVFRLYGTGLAYIWLLFALLYWHAYKQREALQLTPVEKIMTRADLCGFAVSVGVCIVSIGLTFLRVNPFLPGMVYFLIGVGLNINYSWHAKQARLAAAASSPATFTP
jgi:uncharacterized membrane protein